MEDAVQESRTTVSKHKKPKTQDLLGAQQFPQTTERRRSSSSITHTPTPFIGPWYGYPYGPPADDEPTFNHEDEDELDFPSFFQAQVVDQRYDYGGRQYRGPEVREPFSSYRSQDLSEYASEACQRLGCWQSAPHSHDLSERPLTTPRRKPNILSPGFSDEKRLTVHEDDATRETAAIASRDIHIPWNAILSTRKMGTRDLKRALPRLLQKESEIRSPSKLQTHKPPDRQFTLPLRPAQLR